MQNSTIHLREATPEDGPFALWLEEVCMKDHAIALWGNWRPSTTLDNIDLTGHEIIERGGTRVGCIAMSSSDDCLRIHKFYISPDFQNQGIGAYVVKEVCRKANRQGLPIQLNVLTTNPALNFYLREGFSIVAETPERRTLTKR